MDSRGLPSQLGVRPAPELTNQLLIQSFGWMFAGLLLTAGVSALVLANDTLTFSVYRNWYLFLFATIGVGIGIQVLIPKLNATVALAAFFGYAALTGLTVGVIISFYNVQAVITSFLGASAMFGAAAIYGATTKRSLNSIGGFLFRGMIGLFVASIVNIALGSSTIGWVIALIGVVVFTVYTAYTVQRISYGDYAASLGSVEKASVLGAIHLYINFINIFLFLLRLTGGRR
jgi:FtsH-binding integral membrane protein